MARPHLTTDQLDRLTLALRSLCREKNIDPRSHEALKLASRLLDECDGTESVAELSQLFAA